MSSDLRSLIGELSEDIAEKRVISDKLLTPRDRLFKRMNSLYMTTEQKRLTLKQLDALAKRSKSEALPKLPKGAREVQYIRSARFGQINKGKTRVDPRTSKPILDKNLKLHDSWNLVGLNQSEIARAKKKFQEDVEINMFRGFGVIPVVTPVRLTIYRTKNRIVQRLVNDISVKEENARIKKEEQLNKRVIQLVGEIESFLAKAEKDKRELLKLAVKIAMILTEMSSKSLSLKIKSKGLLNAVASDDDAVFKIEDAVENLKVLKKFGKDYAKYIRKHIISRTKAL